MEPVTLLECVFEAVSSGDIELLQQCFGQTTIGTMLEFERLYGVSPLHLCVKIGGIENLPMIQYLLKSGLFDDASVDEDGRTILTFANEICSPELLIALIEVTTDGMDDATACYRILRHDSRELFQKFLTLKNFSEEKEFQYIAGALIQQNVKNVKVSEDLRIFTLWKLSDYGFRHLSGDWPGAKDPNEWKRHVEILQRYSEYLKQHDTEMYDDVNDIFLHRLHTLHNHLYFLKHKPCLKDLPIQETTFCVAIFLSIYRDEPHFQEYRLTVNKCLVIEFVCMISRQLTKVMEIFDKAEKDLLELAEKAYDYQEKNNYDGLIEDLLTKLESAQFNNKEYVVKKYREQANTIASSNKEGLIKELMTKIKNIDKQWADEKLKTLKKLELKREQFLIDEIGKRLCHVPHPQNVANQLMNGLKKGKVTADTVADIVSNEKFNLSHLMEADTATKRKLIDCYTITKQYYSLQKIVYYCEQMIKPANANSDMPCIFANEAYMKRTVQAIGEAIKNTTNSPNLPGKALSAINSMLSERFPETNKLMREVFAHSVSLKKILIGDTDNFILFQTWRSFFKLVLESFNFICILVISDMKVMLYEFMRRCSSIDHLRSLALYVGDITELEKRQTDFHRKVEKCYVEMIDELSKRQMEQKAISPKTRLVQKHLEFNLRIIHDLGKHLQKCANFSYENLWSACRFGNDLETIRRMLNWKRTTTCVDKFYHHMIAWKAPFEEYVNYDPNDLPYLLYTHLNYYIFLSTHLKYMKVAEEFDYIEYTRKLVNSLGVKDEDIKKEALEQLNKKLKPYYNDMGFLSKKWDVLKKFFKEQKLRWDEKTNKMQEDRDKQKIQKKYDDLRGQLRSILEKARLQPDRPTKSLFELPQSMLLAIEYIQLELCEMLQSVGYFGDSFHYVKHRIPMLQGKNYRNFLAHDSLSYNLLTDSISIEKIVINAYVFATREVQLFGWKRNNNVHLTFPSLTEVEQWATKQKQLLEAFQDGSIQSMHDIGKDGGEIKLTRLCCSQNPTYEVTKYFHLADLVNPSRDIKSIVEYLKRYFTGLQDRCNDPAYQLVMAKKLRDFQVVFDRTIANGERLISEKLFDWPELVERLQTTDILNNAASVEDFSDLQNMLKMLIKHGNLKGVLELLPYCECFTDIEHRDLLRDAMHCCQRSITELLLDSTTVQHAEAIQLAIILHWDDIFTRFIDKVELNEATYLLLLEIAIASGNYTAVGYLLETPTLSRFIAPAAEQSALTAAHLGESKFITLILQACSSTMDGPCMAKILFEATLWKRWKCVEILLQNRAPVDMIFYTACYDESCTLLLLVKYGQLELLRYIDRTTINRKELGDFSTLPFATMIKNGTTSKQMIDVLQQLGFDWLDSSMALHEAIRLQNNDNPFTLNGQTSNTSTCDSKWGEANTHDDFLSRTIKMIFNRVDEACTLPPVMHHEHFQLALGVLYRWKCISFLEEPDSDGCSLHYAAAKDDIKMVKKLLEQGRRMRTMPNVGALGGIVFYWKSSYICALKRIQDQPKLNIGDCCKEMIDSMEFYSLALQNWRWQQFTVDAQSITITFHVLTEEEDILELVSNDDAALTFSKSDALLDCLKVLQTFVSSKLSKYNFIFACYSTASEMKHFWQIGLIACMYDVRSPPDDHIDLFDTVNCRNTYGFTPLWHCISIDMVRLLVENGANPLIANYDGITPVQNSIVNFRHEFTVANYLLDECVKRNLRSEQGCSVLELHDTKFGPLIHVAVNSSRLDIIQRLIEYRVDVSAKNPIGLTPAQIAVITRVYKMNQIVQMLFDYDPSSINNTDFTGRTLVQVAVFCDWLDLLKVLLKYKPDLHSVLRMALVLGRNDCAKCILDYAQTNNVKYLTQSENLILLSLKSNNKELTRKLIEYELEHPWAELNEQDLPKLEAIQASITLQRLSDLETINETGFSESADFLQELSLVITKLKVKQNIP